MPKISVEKTKKRGTPELGITQMSGEDRELLLKIREIVDAASQGAKAVMRDPDGFKSEEKREDSVTRLSVIMPREKAVLLVDGVIEANIGLSVTLKAKGKTLADGFELVEPHTPGVER